MTRKLIGPPHAHLDGPCAEACYEQETTSMTSTHKHGEHGWRPIADEVGPLRIIQGHPAQLSDGHHTMEELYDHRLALTAVLAASAATENDSWRSKAHHPDDGPMFEGGYFVVGIELPTGTISYHYKLRHWDDFATVPELEHAPKWDGATPTDTVSRLLELVAQIAPAARPASTPDLPTFSHEKGCLAVYNVPGDRRPCTCNGGVGL
jgi:hypothetical protein